MLQEVRDVLGFYGLYVNYRHLAMLVRCVGLENNFFAFLSFVSLFLSLCIESCNLRLSTLSLIVLQADVMTHRGHLMSITRHGINQQNVGAFQRASFEQTADVLLDACQTGEENALTGVTERIMMGMVAAVGTGAFELVLDGSMLMHAMELPQLPTQLDGSLAMQYPMSPHAMPFAAGRTPQYPYSPNCM